jgi:ketosteroid isomerase-like protein
MERDAEVIRSFYQAFQRRDHATMAACYTPDATFSDPVFPFLRGGAVGAMWRMLCERGTDLRVEAGRIAATSDRGSAHWEAWYTFSGTGRPVHNVIEASFEFHDGLIARHTDAFDLYRWARQALGVKGLLVGWAPPVQRAIRAQAARALETFMIRHGVG